MDSGKCEPAHYFKMYTGTGGAESNVDARGSKVRPQALVTVQNSPRVHMGFL